jgi:ATP-binding protein involved in chromosome partitioning
MTDKRLKAALEPILASIHDPYSGVSWQDLSVLRKCQQDGGSLRILLTFGFPLPESEREQGAAALREAALGLPGVESVEVEHQVKIKAHQVQPGVKAHPQIRNVIAVGSGKGGVGKSTTAVNLAHALVACGARVGILDADIYGPNVPQMLGATEGPCISEDKKWLPVVAQGIQTNSIGFLVDPETPTVWRGPMVSGALMQLLNDTMWDDLDYLVVDLPPGTGDIQLTMAKKLPVTASVMVTTPQGVALQDVQKGISMMRKVEIPLAGLVENMSFFACPSCGERTDIFATGGGEALAKKQNLPFLGKMPLLPAIREAADAGKAVRTEHADISEAYQSMALKVAAWVARRPRGYSQHFGSVEVE